MQRLGVTMGHTRGIGSYEDGNSLVGYNAWASSGWNSKIPDYYLNRLPQHIRDHLNKYPNYPDLHTLFRTNLEHGLPLHNEQGQENPHESLSGPAAWQRFGGG